MGEVIVNRKIVARMEGDRLTFVKGNLPPGLKVDEVRLAWELFTDVRGHGVPPGLCAASRAQGH
eukprot:4353284-Lingulodinium_polyedra.AAC.1